MSSEMPSVRRPLQSTGSIVAVALLISPVLSAAVAGEADGGGTRAREIIEASGVKGGVVVHLGCGDGKLTAELRAGEAYLVHGLEAEAAKVAAARERILKLGKYGPVSVEQFAGERLPYAEDLVNLLVVSDAGRVEIREMLRVLAPRGAILAPGGALDAGGDKLRPAPCRLKGWVKYVKPWPKDIDEWTHFLHDAGNSLVARDRRVGPPDSLQWDAPPRFGRSHEHDTSVPAAVSAGGRIFYILDEGPTGVTDPRLPQKWALIARDAFNGVKLWRRPLKDWGWPQWSPERGKKKWNRIRGVFCAAPRTLARRLVADGGRVFATLGYSDPVAILDATSGEVLRRPPGTGRTEEIVHSGGRLLLVARRGKVRVLLCVDPASGKTLWKRAGKQYIESTLAADGNRAFICDGREVLCLALTDGKVKWRGALPAGPPRHLGRNHILSLTVVDGVLLVLHHKGLHVRDAAGGKLLWKGPGGQGYGMAFPPEVFVTGGAAHYFHKPGQELEPWPNAEALDLRTGKLKRKIEVPRNLIKPRGHTRCYHAKASERYLFLGSRAVEILDLEGRNHVNCYWVKPSCRYGVMPANGMLYVPPNPCQCRITEMLHGFNALVSRGVPGGPAESRPLVRGPAFGKIEAGASTEKPRGEGWPAFRHDSRRSGASRMAGPAKLRELWRVEIGERPVQPVAAAGRLLVPCREGQRLDCLDAAGGRRHWSFFAGGRIDSPPTVHRGAACFGSADGWVYCLRLSDGRLAWKFRAAPAERRIVSRGRLESAWPVHGSPLLLESPDGAATIYLAAGRSSHLDGGIHLYGLDPKTGRQLHHAVVRSGRTDVNSRRTPRPVGALSDVLVTDGERIFMRNLAFDRRLKRVEEAPAGTPGKAGPPRLSAWGGLLEDSTWNRSFWMYARGWPTHYANQAPRSGQLLAFDAETTYALKYFTTRNFHSPMYFPATTGYLLVADDKSAQPYLYDGKPGSKKPLKWLPAVHESQKYVFDHPVTRDPRDIGYTRTAKPKWMKYLPIRARAMVATRGRVYVAGPPDVLKKGDELAAFEGRAGGRLRVVDAADGRTTQELKLDSPPVFDGMIAAYGRIYVATEDGKLLCLGEDTK